MTSASLLYNLSPARERGQFSTPKGPGARMMTTSRACARKQRGAPSAHLLGTVPRHAPFPCTLPRLAPAGGLAEAARWARPHPGRQPARLTVRLPIWPCLCRPPRLTAPHLGVPTLWQKGKGSVTEVTVPPKKAKLARLCPLPGEGLSRRSCPVPPGEPTTFNFHKLLLEEEKERVTVAKAPRSTAPPPSPRTHQHNNGSGQFLP